MTFVNLLFTYTKRYDENDRDIENSRTMLIGFKRYQNCKCRDYEDCSECKCKCGYYDSDYNSDYDSDYDNEECDKPNDCICNDVMLLECFLYPFENEQFTNKMIYLLGTNIKYNYDKHYYYNPDRHDDMKVYDVTPDNMAEFRLQTINFLNQINKKYNSNITRCVHVVGEW